MSKKNLILVIIISLIVGFLGGYFLKREQKTPREISVKPQEQEQENVIKLKQSKAIRKWTAIAEGKVDEISDRQLTLVADSESLKILIIEGAPVSSFSLSEKKSKELEFKDIKIGDFIDVLVELKDDQLIGTSIMVTH